MGSALDRTFPPDYAKRILALKEDAGFNSQLFEAYDRANIAAVVKSDQAENASLQSTRILPAVTSPSEQRQAAPNNEPNVQPLEKPDGWHAALAIEQDVRQTRRCCGNSTFCRGSCIARDVGTAAR